MPRRRSAVALLVCLSTMLLPAFAEAAPSTSPQRVGPPDSVALLGDSISAGTGTSGLPSAEQPANSWGTGTNSSVNSVFQRIVALNPAAAGRNFNQASNGKKMIDMAGQANSMPVSTQLVLVQLGGNDLCKDTVAQMTTVATYRSQFIAGLNAIAARAPDALVQVSSIPDIFNLWFLRGAPNPPNDQPSSRAGTARLFWDTFGVIPCKSLVDNPTDMSAAAVARRLEVRQRTIALNQVLAEECANSLRCRFDNNAIFSFSSNRTDPLTDSSYLPRNEWRFVDDDISTIDHFHPSLSGQTKLAEVAWDSGYDFTDTSAPTAAADQLTPPPLANGVSLVPTTVSSTWSDPAGIKGVEYRVHRAAGPGPWIRSADPAVAITVTDTGLSWVETRAIDSNGNLSASRVTEVNLDPGAVPVPSIVSAPSGQSGSSVATISFSGEAGLSFECSLDGSSYATCASPLELTGLAEGGRSLAIRQVGPGGERGGAATVSWTVDLTAPSAPVLSNGPPASTKLRTASIHVSGESLASLTCSLDGAPFTACTSPINLSGLADGERSLAVRQTDRAGNISPTSSLSWVVDTVAPNAPLLSGIPPVFTSQTTLVLTLSGEAGATFSCSSDGAAFLPCVSPLVRTGMANGLRSISVRQTDLAGNASPATSGSWNIDTVAPGPPMISGAPTGTTLQASATVSFSGEPSATFRCSLDDAVFSPCSSPTVLSGLTEGLRTFSIRQVDRAGNIGPDASSQWTVDTPPMPPSIGGAPGGLTAQNGATLTLTGRAGAAFTCALDGAAFGACTSPVTLGGLADGPHTFAARQTTPLGATSVSSSVNWTVDATAPTTPVFSGAPDPVTSLSTAVARFDGEPGGRFECRLDNGPWESCTPPVSLTALSDGPHAFASRQIDQAGNVGAVGGFEWAIDTIRPEAPDLDGPGPLLVRSRSAGLSFNGEAELSFECRLNNSGWSGCSSPVTLTGLRQGRQVFEVRQTDPAGNVGDVGSRSWLVDTVAPRLTRVRVRRLGRRTVLISAFTSSRGRPAKLEYSSSRSKPGRSARGRSVRWARRLTVRSARRITWVRVSDAAGNRSPWTKPR